MATISSTLLLLIIISTIQTLNHLALAEVVMSSCLDSDNYTANSTYAANLALLLSSQPESKYGFYNVSSGQEPDTVYGFGLCRADIAPEACSACIDNSSANISSLCPDRKKGFAWFELCMIRYSDTPMYGLLVDNNVMGHWSNSESTNATMFMDNVYTLLLSLQTKTSLGDWRLKAAVGNLPVDPMFQTIYALTQCTPDLSEGECLNCLATIASYIQKWTYNKRGARFCAPSCYLRYETNHFYEFSADVNLTAPDTSTNSQDPNDILTVESLQIDFGIIRDATNDFSELNKIGKGGFGAVYKGELQDGQYIAAKRLSASSGQGDEEFKNEVRLVAKLQHKNLVRLQGFCLERKEKLLVYEFVHNASLDHHLFDRIKRLELSWEKRYNIITGIVRGLVYLHEDSRLRIIHRDLKASNVLLDAKMEPKISDFGMAKLIEMDQTYGNTRKIAGTYGYMAPEYAYKGYFSVKSDVFSFGVLVLEIVAGQRNGRFQDGPNVEDLKSYAWKSWSQGTAIDMVDPMLRDCGSTDEMLKCIQIGLLCIQENAESRPTMATVDRMLNSDSTTIAAPAQPGFFVHTTADEPDRPDIIGQVQGSVKETLVTELYGR